MTKHLRVTMPNGERWAVPISIIAEGRATYYADRDAERQGLSKEERNKRYREEVFYALGDEYEIRDWASNNMDWTDVRDRAINIGAEELDDRGYQEGWINGEKKIIDLDEDGKIV